MAGEASAPTQKDVKWGQLSRKEKEKIQQYEAKIRTVNTAYKKYQEQQQHKKGKEAAKARKKRQQEKQKRKEEQERQQKNDKIWKTMKPTGLNFDATLAGQERQKVAERRKVEEQRSLLVDTHKTIVAQKAEKRESNKQFAKPDVRKRQKAPPTSSYKGGFLRTSKQGRQERGKYPYYNDLL